MRRLYVKKGFLALIALVLVMGTVLAGCGKTGGSANQVFRMNLSTEPPSLDPGTAQDQTSFTVLVGLYEGLTRMDSTGTPVAGMATKWDVQDNGKKYIFHLRKDAKWTNGDPVTAHDFEYAWKRALDPNLNPPSPYAYQLYYLTNAEEYNSKKADASKVGVKATDDYTLEVDLKAPTPYFLSLTSFFTYYPLDEKALKGNDKWASEASTMVTNGPFKLAEWKHNDHIKLVKNDAYYDAKSIKFNEIDMAMVNDPNTELSMYQTDQLDWAGRPDGDIPLDQIPTLKKDPKMNLQIKGIASTYYYEFNTTQPPYNNVNIRKALAMGIERQQLVDNVTKGEQIPAFGFVSGGIKGVGDKTFRESYDDHQYFKEDATAAKALLAKGLQELNMDKLPPVVLLYNTSEGHKKIAEAIAEMWRKNLGVTVQLKNEEWKVFLKDRTALNYQVARAGWGADYNDPMTFIDMWTSTSGNNDTGFKNADYDALVKDAYSTSDNKKRMDDMAQAEKILVQDNMVVMPIYYYTGIWLQKSYVKNVLIDYAGNMDYTRGSISK